MCIRDRIESQLDIDFSDAEITFGAITTVSSIGYVLWALRGGALMAFAMSQLPSWQIIDPLLVLDSYSKNGTAEVDELGDFFK